MSRHSSSVMPSVRAEFHSSLAFSSVSMMGIAAGVTNNFRQRRSFSVGDDPDVAGFLQLLYAAADGAFVKKAQLCQLVQRDTFVFIDPQQEKLLSAADGKMPQTKIEIPVGIPADG